MNADDLLVLQPGEAATHAWGIQAFNDDSYLPAGAAATRTAARQWRRLYLRPGDAQWLSRDHHGSQGPKTVRGNEGTG